MKQKIIYIFIACLLFTFLAACQPTPSNTIIANKGDTDLEANIQKTAGASEVSTKNEERWTCEKDYDSGNRLLVDAVMYHTDVDKLPVLSIAPKMFESGDQLKNIVKVFCPNMNTKIYDQGGRLTKSQLAKSIMDVKEEIFRVENVGNGSHQSNMLATAGDAALSIDFANVPSGNICSGFYFESSKLIFENIGTSDKFVTPESLEGDTQFIKTKQKIDQCVKNMGVDYMSLNIVSKGENSYSFYYMRTYNGLQETYVNEHIGMSATGVDFGPMIYLWTPEYLYI